MPKYLVNFFFSTFLQLLRATWPKHSKIQFKTSFSDFSKKIEINLPKQTFCLRKLFVHIFNFEKRIN